VIYDAVADGKHILYGMLLTALVFCAIIALGELTKWAGHRRADRKRQTRSY
jgi:hypothetical protein